MIRLWMDSLSYFTLHRSPQPARVRFISQRERARDRENRLWEKERERETEGELSQLPSLMFESNAEKHINYNRADM